MDEVGISSSHSKVTTARVISNAQNSCIQVNFHQICPTLKIPAPSRLSIEQFYSLPTQAAFTWAKRTVFSSNFGPVWSKSHKNGAEQGPVLSSCQRGFKLQNGSWKGERFQLHEKKKKNKKPLPNKRNKICRPVNFEPVKLRDVRTGY